ncbi:MAG: hypothetical protein LUD50_00485 [Clostridia bacterium]|nr:hypothetical protein [Clostridia bacterium]
MTKEEEFAAEFKKFVDRQIAEHGAVVIEMSPDGSKYVFTPADKYVKDNAPEADDSMNYLYWEDMWFRR